MPPPKEIKLLLKLRPSTSFQKKAITRHIYDCIHQASLSFQNPLLLSQHFTQNTVLTFLINHLNHLIAYNQVQLGTAFDNKLTATVASFFSFTFKPASKCVADWMNEYRYMKMSRIRGKLKTHAKILVYPRFYTNFALWTKICPHIITLKHTS